MPLASPSPHTRFKTEYRMPSSYTVYLLNDDFTTMEFVIELLRTVFFHDEATASHLMLKVHNEGEAAVGRYTKDIAEGKKAKAERLARENEFPLRLEIREDCGLPF